MNRKISSFLAFIVLGTTLSIYAGGDQKPIAGSSSSLSTSIGSALGATVTLVSVSADRIESGLAFLPNHPYFSLAGVAIACYFFKPSIDALVTSMEPSLLKAALGMFFGTSKDLVELKTRTEQTQKALTELDKKVDVLGEKLSSEQKEGLVEIKSDIAKAQAATTKNLELIDKKIVEVSTKATKAGTDIATLTEKTERLQKQVETLQHVIESQSQALALLPTMAHAINDVRANLQRAAGSRWFDSSKSTFAQPKIDGLFERFMPPTITDAAASSPAKKTPAIASASSAGGPTDEASSSEDENASENESTSEEETVSPQHTTSSIVSEKRKSSVDTTATESSRSARLEKPSSSEHTPRAITSSRGLDALASSMIGRKVTSAVAVLRNQAVPHTNKKSDKKAGTCTNQ